MNGHEPKCLRKQPEAEEGPGTESSSTSQVDEIQAESETPETTSDEALISPPPAGAGYPCEHSDELINLTENETHLQDWVNQICSIEPECVSTVTSQNSGPEAMLCGGSIAEATSPEIASPPETQPFPENLKSEPTTLQEPTYSFTNISLASENAIRPSQVSQTDSAGCNDELQDVSMADSNSDEQTIPLLLPIEHPVRPALPEEVAAFENAFSGLEASKDSAPQPNHPTKAITEPEHVAEAPRPRKMARATSPRIKLLKMQQEIAQQVEVSIANSTETEEHITIQCTTPESTIVRDPPPSPPASECSTTSDDSINFITSPPSSTTSHKRSPSPPNVTDGVDGPSPYSVGEGLEAQNGAAEQSASPKDTDQQHENLYMKDPSEVAEWIERSTSRQSSSSESGNCSMASTSPTKQQRKKANRKARQRTLELAIKMEQEMLAERMRVDEAKKEHQKLKKERKKLEKEIGGAKKGKSQTTQATTKAKKERKIGYVIG